MTAGGCLAHDPAVSVGIVNRPEPNPSLEHLLGDSERMFGSRKLDCGSIYPHGRELRILVGDVLFWSGLYRDDEDSRELGGMSSGTLQNFEGHGWTRDAEPAEWRLPVP